MMKVILTLTLLACGDKENQSFEDFQADYFHARQGDELTDACNAWYEDCVAAGYAEDDCGSRLEYCEDGEWNTGEDGGDREEEADREESDCDARATRVYEECISAGGSEEECRERVAQFYEDCENEERE